MSKHTIVINMLKDNQELICKDILLIQTILAKLKFREELFPNQTFVRRTQTLHYKRVLRDKLTTGRAIDAAIKRLEEDI